MKKISTRITVSIFCFFIGIFFFLNLILPDKSFSDKENRSLQTIPKFTLTSLFNGTYTSRFESYCSDQFAFRDQWIEIKAAFELLLGKTENNDVYFCDGDRLLEAYSAPDDDRIALSAASNDVLLNADVPVSFALIPTSTELYSDLLPNGAPSDDQSLVIDKAYAATSLQTIDILSALAEHADEPIFYRTDHHWTSLGAMYAANAIRSSWGIPEIDIDTLSEEVITEDFCGTLYSSSGFFWVEPDTMEILVSEPSNSGVHQYETNGTEKSLPIYNWDKLSVKDKYSFFLGGVIPRAVIDTGTENKPSLLIVRDSYSDSLVPFLLDEFSEIHLLDLRYYTGSVTDYITEYGIDRVLVLYGINNFSTDASIRIN